MSVKLSTFDRKWRFFILLGGKIISRQELARRFGVNRAAIHRDITVLSRYIPISSKIVDLLMSSFENRMNKQS